MAKSVWEHCSFCFVYQFSETKHPTQANKMTTYYLIFFSQLIGTWIISNCWKAWGWLVKLLFSLEHPKAKAGRVGILWLTLAPELMVPMSVGLDQAAGFFFVLLSGTLGFSWCPGCGFIQCPLPSLCKCVCVHTRGRDAGSLKAVLASLMRRNIEMLMNRKVGPDSTLCSCERVSVCFLQQKSI